MDGVRYGLVHGPRNGSLGPFLDVLAHWVRLGGPKRRRVNMHALDPFRVGVVADDGVEKIPGGGGEARLGEDEMPSALVKGLFNHAVEMQRLISDAGDRLNESLAGLNHLARAGQQRHHGIAEASLPLVNLEQFSTMARALCQTLTMRGPFYVHRHVPHLEFAGPGEELVEASHFERVSGKDDGVGRQCDSHGDTDVPLADIGDQPFQPERT